jgi:hypothetical protein
MLLSSRCKAMSEVHTYSVFSTFHASSGIVPFKLMFLRTLTTSYRLAKQSEQNISWTLLWKVMKQFTYRVSLLIVTLGNWNSGPGISAILLHYSKWPWLQVKCSSPFIYLSLSLSLSLSHTHKENSSIINTAGGIQHKKVVLLTNETTFPNEKLQEVWVLAIQSRTIHFISHEKNKKSQ